MILELRIGFKSILRFRILGSILTSALAGCCITGIVKRLSTYMLKESKEANGKKESHTTISWSLCKREARGQETFAGEGVLHELKVQMPHQLFIAMCRAELEAILFAIRTRDCRDPVC